MLFLCKKRKQEHFFVEYGRNGKLIEDEEQSNRSSCSISIEGLLNGQVMFVMWLPATVIEWRWVLIIPVFFLLTHNLIVSLVLLPIFDISNSIASSQVPNQEGPGHKNVWLSDWVRQLEWCGIFTAFYVASLSPSPSQPATSSSRFSSLDFSFSLAKNKFIYARRKEPELCGLRVIHVQGPRLNPGQVDFVIIILIPHRRANN